ncbi:MAG: alpha/beta hydrolase [Deltaproteobacteria bacterium]|nr:alpha/beta hydrolase [Deltaproteobacteria bacterium]
MSVGCRAIEVTDAVQGVRVPTWLLYPAEAIERVEPFGTYSLSVAKEAPIDGDQRPLVVISHGTGSTPWVLRDLALHLVRGGFVVALLAHPGNTRRDDSLAHTPINLINRPRHIRLVIDAAFADREIGPRLVPDAAAVIGHSLGGYTALALAGGRPMALPHESPDGQGHPFSVETDARVRALVLLAPAAPWLMVEGALGAVDVPVLMRTGEKDLFSPTAFDDVLLRGFPDRTRIDYRIVLNAGHFSFLSPFPPAMVHPQFPPSQDPPGFDRAAYLLELHAEVQAFLRRQWIPTE